MKKKTIEVEFEIGQIVFLKTDPDQTEFIVTGYMIGSSESIWLIGYMLRYSCGETTTHQGFEITESKKLF